MSENQKQTLEVEIVIPQDVIDREENQSIKKIYSPEKKALIYTLGAETTEDFKEKLRNVIRQAPTNNIAAINPVIDALNWIQGFKVLKYDAEAKNGDQYTKAKTTLGTMNTKIKDAAKVLKAEASAYLADCRSLEALLLDEVKIVRGAIDENFKEFLEEKARIAEEKAAKRDAEKNATIQQLTESGAETAEKLANQQKATRKLEVEAIINRVIVEVTRKIPDLNEEGLMRLRESVNNSKLGEVDSPIVQFTDVEKGVFNMAYSREVVAAVKLIDDKITMIKQSEALKESNVEVAPITPVGTPPPPPNATAAVPTPTEQPAPPQQHTEAPAPPPAPAQDKPKIDLSNATDEMKLVAIAKFVSGQKNEIQAFITKVQEVHFDDPQAKAVADNILKLFGNIDVALGKTEDYAKQKSLEYYNFKNQNK